MADVQAHAGRVRELDQRVELRLGEVLRGDEAFLLVPDMLPFGLDGLMIVFVQRYNPQLCATSRRSGRAEKNYCLSASSTPSSASETGVPSFHRFSRL